MSEPTALSVSPAPLLPGFRDRWRIRVLMHDAQAGREIVLSSADRAEEAKAAHALEVFPAFEGYSVFSIAVEHGAEVTRRPICGAAFAEKMGVPIELLIRKGRTRPIDMADGWARPGPEARPQ